MPLPRRHIPLPDTGFLAGMRIRKKLIVLHTFFSLVLVTLLTLALRPAVNRILERAELHEAKMVAEVSSRLLVADPDAALPPTVSRLTPQQATELLRSTRQPASTEQRASAPSTADSPANPAAHGIEVRLPDGTLGVVLQVPSARGERSSGLNLLATARLDEARDAVIHVYAVLILSLLAVYALIALALEVVVLPRHVYGPIRAILKADQAVRDNRRADELLDETQIPADELGEIMRSHNRTVTQLRDNERTLASTMQQLEQTLADLKRKNHLLEMAQRNLADADRLASLGVMSAGLAHEMNTPLAVIKGLTETLGKNGKLERPEIELMLRVTGRLEKLSESLLDFARVRPMTTSLTPLRPLVEEAWTLVKLDRGIGGRVEMINGLPEGDPADPPSLFADDATTEPAAAPSHHPQAPLMAQCDGDRIVQVLVNLLRNACDATLDSRSESAGAQAAAHSNAASSRDPAAPTSRRWTMDGKPRITVSGQRVTRDNAQWTMLLIADEGPGIDAAIATRLFEPFASTRLDSRGTGLGLAVSEGIIREHGGLLLARNRTDGPGAVFEMLLPAS